MHFRWLFLGLLPAVCESSWYDKAEEPWNLNTAQDASQVLDYASEWPNHEYFASPKNWRMPFYSFFPDRFVNGDPTNDNANHTAWEHDHVSNQFRFGGDLQGVVDSLDYIHGLGIRSIYLSGSLFLNQAWGTDGFSPYDLTILDHHHGTLSEIRNAIQKIHDKGIWVIVENTFATMADIYTFEGFENTTAPFSFTEHKLDQKSTGVYRDFAASNKFHDDCPWDFPRYWNQGGQLYNDENTTKMVGCMDSEFDQFGDTGAFGVYPEWQKQLSKFGGVQDRLRDWRPSVLDKIVHFSCMWIKGLDIDGFRMDKAMQITIDPLGNFSNRVRECASEVGKTNFFIPGEIVNGNTNGAIYIGRGKDPSMQYNNVSDAITANDSTYIRQDGFQGLDSGAFHYSTYRALMRFLGLDGVLSAAEDAPVNFADQWQVMVKTNDMRNAYDDKFDPRHMYGASNQDVLRWPGLINGTERQLLAEFIVTMAMPGIPMVNWGEEQAFYTLDSTAPDYIFGRQPMASAQAWQMHGCYKIGDNNLNDWPASSLLHACHDDNVSLDHRDPSSPLYGVFKQMFELRERYPVLNDGFMFQQLSAQVDEYKLPGSAGGVTEHGLYSSVRGVEFELQEDLQTGHGNQMVWLLYSNRNYTEHYVSDCTDDQSAIAAPFVRNTTVRNLFWPFETYELKTDAAVNPFLGGTSIMSGCLNNVVMEPYGFKALVPVQNWTLPSPVITKFLPGHDHRFVSNTSSADPDSVEFELRFSDEMDCDSVKNSLSFQSATEHNQTASLADSVTCQTIENPKREVNFTGPSASMWYLRATLNNVYDGVHRISVNNATNQAGNASTQSTDHFMFRIGQPENVMVFPKLANYSDTLVFRTTNDQTAKSDGSNLRIGHKAAGADKWRFSASFGILWSDWIDYVPGNASLPNFAKTSIDEADWQGQHIKVQYWSQLAGSSDHIIEGDVESSATTRRYPHFYVHGSFNQYGYDQGLPNKMAQSKNGTWTYDFMDEWPSQFQLNVFGMARDGTPDKTVALGDINNDTILDRVNPVSLQASVTNITAGPGSPHLSYRISFDDGTMRYYLVPLGNRWVQLAIWFLLATIPVATGALGVWLYISAFYGVKFNETGATKAGGHWSSPLGWVSKRRDLQHGDAQQEKIAMSPAGALAAPSHDRSPETSASYALGASGQRRCVLIATIEYEIADWDIKIKIGGLGVMAQLMGKNLQDQDLVWVVPCAEGFTYPTDTPGLPIDVTIFGRTYEVQVQYHKLNNITYMLVDAPVFRRQTAKDPYPARMDDLDSAIYYSAWNQCIAEAMRRFPIDIYHINDYHGAIAPLYLLPDTVPCCLSLHNAEFQGLWPMRSKHEAEEICNAFNLPEPVVRKYVQFGEVFNLLHAGASILRIHQKGFGAVGVSKKYSKRTLARYPIFWGLKRIGSLPNPDPSDTAVLDEVVSTNFEVDPVFESGRALFKKQTQAWAGLEQRPDAELFVFVGRWSQQKGVDLIADVFPAILEAYPQVQLLCVGPTIDLYGTFAALKLDVMQQKYPGRVFSKPEFTALPSFIFSGAEFALIPSRDEPFGLVAVEFGRKGALGVGSRVGGLGQMPGWWYTIESQGTKHQIRQFKTAITDALASSVETRASMRARSAKQRFPVAQWKQDIELLHSASIRTHKRTIDKKKSGLTSGSTTPGWATPSLPGWMTPRDGATSRGGSGTPAASQPNTRPPSPTRETSRFSLGIRSGPGHLPTDQAASSQDDGTTGSQNSQAEVAATFDAIPEEEEYLSPASAEAAKRNSQLQQLAAAHLARLQNGAASTLREPTPDSEMTTAFFSPVGTPGTWTPNNNSYLVLPMTPLNGPRGSGTQTPLSTQRVVDEKSDKTLTELTPFFKDSTGLYARKFEEMLSNLNGKNSEKEYCIEEYLEKSEKAWFRRMDKVMMSSSVHSENDLDSNSEHDEPVGQFLLPENYAPPTGIRKLLNYKLGDWPVYSFLLALGQILAANSYQITLLTGQEGQTATQLYCIASIYLASSLVWWCLFRRLPCMVVMTLPFFFYGMGFFLLAFAPYGSTTLVRAWVQYVATGMYAIGSAAGSLFFSQNFGSSGSAPVKDWAFRACAVQGTQQIYVIALWAWGTHLTTASSSGTSTDYAWRMTVIGLPIAILLWTIGILLWFGLPDFYRQKPGVISSFYKAALRRKIVIWFLIAVLIQNFFMSAQYGRNWSYLWSSQHAPTYAVVLLVFLFFIVIWGAILFLFSRLSVEHSWILPVCAICIGAPRWCQIWWAVSNMGSYLPWAGGPVASAILGRALWLWLGVLDALQGVGIGMLLLQTLTRLHISFALIMAQCVGSVATIINRADGLSSTGPLPYYPTLAHSISEGLSGPGFWICMLAQIAVCIGYIAFFRKEQLSKP
jgi:alpha-1,3-glucan synthase